MFGASCQLGGNVGQLRLLGKSWALPGRFRFTAAAFVKFGEGIDLLCGWDKLTGEAGLRGASCLLHNIKPACPRWETISAVPKHCW